MSCNLQQTETGASRGSQDRGNCSEIMLCSSLSVLAYSTFMPLNIGLAKAQNDAAIIERIEMTAPEFDDEYTSRRYLTICCLGENPERFQECQKEILWTMAILRSQCMSIRKEQRSTGHNEKRYSSSAQRPATFCFVSG
ncbi:hypothetical protein AC578_6041, partial [Pseudocercospora eumusae]